MRHARRRTAGVVAAILLLCGCTAQAAPSGSATRAAASTAVSAPASSGGASTVAVRQLLAALHVQRESSGDRRYDRELFGYGGDLDPDRDGCYTRREVLIRDSIAPVRIGSSCFVTGEWRSSFDDRVTRDPNAFTIDHTVPLLEAWRSGADAWPSQRLVAYGNDLGYRWSLQAVTAQLNEDKGNSDPASWLPPLHRCRYVAEWVGVKARWGLSIDSEEVAAIQQVLAGCGDLRVARPGMPDLVALT